MRQVLLSGLFVAAVLLGRNVGPHTATAQPPRDDKKAAAAGVIEIAQGKDDKYRFFVRDGDGKLLAMSSPSGFENVKDAQTAITQLKDVVSKAKVNVVKKESKDGKDGK